MARRSKEPVIVIAKINKLYFLCLDYFETKLYILKCSFLKDTWFSRVHRRKMKMQVEGSSHPKKSCEHNTLLF